MLPVACCSLERRCACAVKVSKLVQDVSTLGSCTQRKSVVICSTPGLGSIELPDNMSRLTSLRCLILSGWCYSSLPGVVGRLSQIQELDFRSAA